jgi:polar amino acid transport system substrate-binding protein
MKALMLLLFLSFPLYSNETIHLAIGNWEPFTSSSNQKSQNLELLVKEAFSIENIDVVYKYYPWIRSHEMVRAGQADGTFPWIKTGEREDNFYFSKEVIIVEKTVFFHLRNTQFDWVEYDDLKKYNIGGTLGYAVVEPLEQVGIQIQYTGLEDLNFKKLLAGRIDTYPASFYVGHYLIGKLFADSDTAKFTYHPKPLSELSYYLMISRNIPDGERLIEIFDSGLRHLKNTGRYDEILSGINKENSR